MDQLHEIVEVAATAAANAAASSIDEEGEMGSRRRLGMREEVNRMAREAANVALQEHVRLAERGDADPLGIWGSDSGGAIEGLNNVKNVVTKGHERKDMRGGEGRESLDGTVGGALLREDMVVEKEGERAGKVQMEPEGVIEFLGGEDTDFDALTPMHSPLPSPDHRHHNIRKKRLQAAIEESVEEENSQDAEEVREKLVETNVDVNKGVTEGGVKEDVKQTRVEEEEEEGPTRTRKPKEQSFFEKLCGCGGNKDKASKDEDSESDSEANESGMMRGSAITETVETVDTSINEPRLPKMEEGDVLAILQIFSTAVKERLERLEVRTAHDATEFKLNTATKLFRNTGDSTPYAYRCLVLYQGYQEDTLESSIDNLTDLISVSNGFADALRLFDDHIIPNYHITSASEGRALPPDAGTGSYGPIQLKAWETIIRTCVLVIQKGAAPSVACAALAEVLIPRQGLWRLQGPGAAKASSNLKQALLDCIQNSVQVHLRSFESEEDGTMSTGAGGGIPTPVGIAEEAEVESSAKVPIKGKVRLKALRSFGDDDDDDDLTSIG